MSSVDTSPTPFFVAGGTVPPGAPSYVERAADRELFDALCSGEYCYVLNSRQMGKSSLAVRAVERLKQAGIRTAFIDLTRVGGATVTADQWYAGLVAETGRTLDLRREAAAFLREHRDLGPAPRFLTFLHENALAAEDSRMVVFIDEIDAIRNLSFSTDDLFAGIRQLHNARASEPELNRLTFCLLGAALPSDLIRDARTTPFNVGRRIDLRDFTPEEAKPFGDAMGVNGARRLARVLYWTGGHPFLTQALCADLAREPSLEVDALVRRRYLDERARETDTNLADVGNRILGRGDPNVGDGDRADVLSVYAKVLKRGFPDDESNPSCARIKMSGATRLAGGRLVIRNRIYRQVFGRKWITGNMPGQELRRQRRAFYGGVLRTGLVAFVVVGIISALALNSLRLARIARSQRDLARYEAYTADMNSMRAAYDDNDLVLLSSLLEDTRAWPSRNIEWNYWSAKLHDAAYETEMPHGFGNMSVSADGKSVAIDDLTTEEGAIFSYPDLRLVHRIGRIPRSEALIELGGRWVLVNASSRDSFPIRDAIENRPVGSLSFGSGSLFSETQSNAGNAIATASGARGAVHPEDLTVWDGHTFSPKHRLKVKGVNARVIAVSDDGRMVADQETPIGSPNLAEDYFQRIQVAIRDISSGAVVDRFPIVGLIGYGAQMSNDGRYLGFSLTNSGVLKVRDVRAHRFSLDVVVPPVNGIVFSRDDHKMLTDGVDLAACLWDLTTGRVIEKRKGAVSASMPLDASSIAVSGAGTRVYTVNSGAHDSITIPNTWATVAGVNQKGWLVVATGHSIRFLDSETFKTVHPLVRVDATLGVLSADANWRMNVLGSAGSDVVNTATDAILCRIGVWSVSPNAMDVSARQVAAIDDRSRFVVGFDRAGKELWRYESKDSPALCCRWSPDGQTLGVGLMSGTVCLLDARTGRLVRLITDYNANAYNLVFSHDGSRLAIVGGDLKVPLIDLRTGRLSVVCRGHHASVEAAAFSPDDSRLATASDDGTTRLWDPKTGKQMLQINSGTVPMSGVVFSPDDRQFYTSDNAGTIRVYRTPKPTAEAR